MPYPSLRVEIAFASDPMDDTPTWEDVSAYVRDTPTVHVKRGGNGEPQGHDQPGTCEFVLSNRDRRFDPTYAAGPYFGQLKARKQVRVTAVEASVDYPVFYGWVTGFPVSGAPGGVDSTVNVMAYDAISALAGALLAGDPLHDYLDGLSAIHTWWRQTTPTKWVDSEGAAESRGVGDLISGASMCTGSVSPSARFDGQTYHRPVALETGAAPVGVSFWITAAPDRLATRNLLFGEDTLSAVLSISISGSDGLAFWEYDDGTGSTFAFYSTNAIDDSFPHHIATYVTGGSVYFYVDGVLQGSAATTRTIMKFDVVAAGAADASGRPTSIVGGFALQDLLSLSVVVDVEQIYNLSVGVAVESTADRVSRILDDCGWPASWRTIATDTRGTVSELVYNGQKALTALQQVERSEQGRIFAAKDGKLTFLGRYAYAEVARHRDVQAIISDDGSDYAYRNYDFNDGDDDVCNDMTVRNNLNTARSTNTASQSEYGTIADTTDTNLSTLAQVRDMAAGLVYQRKDAATRFKPITVSPPTTWAPLLGLELGDRVEIEGTPMGVGSQSSAEVLIESIEWSISAAAGWWLTISGQPVPANTFWLLGTSVLGVDTVPGF